MGPNHYIQMINGSGGGVFRIYNKAGTLLAGPTNLETLGTGSCASGLVDPIVLYDQLADRWFMSEFSNTGNRLCVYISQTPNPVSGGWFAYQFTATSFPDYPKYGVGPDAYYVGTNENSPAAYALQRTAMLTGAAATSQRFTAPALSGFPFQLLLSALFLNGPFTRPQLSYLATINLIKIGGCPIYRHRFIVVESRSA